jgi:hypothetical protein
MHIFIYVFLYLFVCLYVYLHLCLYAFSIDRYIYMPYIRKCTYAYIYIYTNIYICTRAYIYIYVCRNRRWLTPPKKWWFAKKDHSGLFQHGVLLLWGGVEHLYTFVHIDVKVYFLYRYANTRMPACACVCVRDRIVYVLYLFGCGT